MLLPLELKPCKTLWSGDVVCTGLSAGFLGKGTAALGLKPLALEGQYWQSAGGCCMQVYAG